MRRALALAAALIIAPALHAQDVSREQATALQAMLGFDAAMPTALDDALKRHGSADWTPAQRTCVAGHVQPLMQESLDRSIAELFGSTDTAKGWLDFAATDAGRKMLASVREVVAASVARKSRPTEAEAEADSAPPAMPQFTDEETMAMLAFMTSPAAQVLSRDFPEPELDPERIAALQPRIESTCGVAFAR